MCLESNTGEAVVISRKLFMKDVDGESRPCAEFRFGKKSVATIDKCMKDIIEDLNRNGHPTILSCCCHGKKEPFIIMYAKKGEDEKKAVAIIEKYWGKNNHTIEYRSLWLDFMDYRCVVIGKGK